MSDQKTLLQTLEQKRARRALEGVGTAQSQKLKDYASVVKRAPADIQTNGLGQTLAFWKSKDIEKQILYQQVSEWVAGQMGWTNEDLLTRLTSEQATISEYRRATVEAQTFLVWVKRLAEGMLDSEESGDGKAG